MMMNKVGRDPAGMGTPRQVRTTLTSFLINTRMSTSSSDQEKVVLRVLACKPNQFYEILEVDKLSSDAVIKKSYRKLAIKLHPDKNPHPRASEAFKYLNKAWGVLSDPSKKRIYDQTGSDPDSRGAGYDTANATSAFSGARGFQGAGFESDIFNMFFNGAARPGTTYTFGNGNGFTFQSFGGAQGFDPFGNVFAQQQSQRQRRGHSQQPRQREPDMWETIRQLAPILFVLFAMLLSSLFSGESSPEYSFTQNSKFSLRRTTPNYKIPFYVKQDFVNDKSGRALKNFDAKVENIYVQDKRGRCSREQMRKNEMIEDAQGWFYTDNRKLEAAYKYPMPNCEILRGLGVL